MRPPGQAITPPRKPNKIAFPRVQAAREEAGHRHSSKRITVEHARADHKRWKHDRLDTPMRDLPGTCRASAGLVSDRTITA
ncbi:transposase [Streptomyces sp. NBC_01077]|uniref:transposase n=1 Tax=Streptomyces sp. NBC_01077 TaxID=2903746 RepID=UPI0038638232